MGPCVQYLTLARKKRQKHFFFFFKCNFVILNFGCWLLVSVFALELNVLDVRKSCRCSKIRDPVVDDGVQEYGKIRYRGSE